MVTVSSGTTITLTFPSNVTAGNAIIVVVNGANGTYSAADTRGNTYAVAATESDGGLALGVAIILALNIAGGADTVTVTLPLAPGSAVAQEWSGLVTSAATDQTAVSDGTTAGPSPTSGTTAATSQASELAIAVMCDNTGLNPETITDPTGWTNIYHQTNGATYDAGAAAYKVLSATGTQVATWGTGDNVNWVGCIATFKAAGGTAYARNAADTTSVGESPARVYTGARRLSDAVLATDMISRVQTLVRGLADAVAGTADSASRAFMGIRSTAESTTSADSAVRVFTGARTPAETTAASDAAARQQTLGRSLSDVLSAISEVVTAVKNGGGTAYVRGVAEIIITSDAVLRVQALARGVGEALTSGDAAQRAQTLARSAADALSAMTDAVARAFSGTRTGTETLVTGDVVRRAASYTRSIADVVSGLSDRVTASIPLSPLISLLASWTPLVAKLGSWVRAILLGSSWSAILPLRGSIMSTESAITSADHWAAKSNRILQFAIVDVNGARLDVSSYTLEWRLLTAKDGRLLHRWSAAVISFTSSLGDSIKDVVNVAVAPADYVDVNGGAQIGPGNYYHELWRIDIGSTDPLSFGPVVLE